MALSPKDILEKWIKAFNNRDPVAIGELYDENAVNHQVVNDVVTGKESIVEMFAVEFQSANMTCIPENIFQDGEWAIMEWKDPLGMRGCGFFRIRNEKIVFQRGYWDKQSFFKLHGLLDNPNV